MFKLCWVARGIKAIRDFCHRRKRRCEFRAANKQCVASFDLREESVTATRNRFYKTWAFGRIAEGIADFVDRFIEPVIEIPKRVCGPESLLKFLTAYDFTRA